MIQELPFNDTCPICLDELTKDARVIQVCGHALHKDCAVKWWSRKPHCPICRKVDPRVVQLLCKALQTLLEQENRRPSLFNYTVHGLMVLLVPIFWGNEYLRRGLLYFSGGLLSLSYAWSMFEKVVEALTLH